MEFAWQTLDITRELSLYYSHALERRFSPVHLPGCV